jgi:hypothetical protein
MFLPRPATVLISAAAHIKHTRRPIMMCRDETGVEMT